MRLNGLYTHWHVCIYIYMCVCIYIIIYIYNNQQSDIWVSKNMVPPNPLVSDHVPCSSLFPCSLIFRQSHNRDTTVWPVSATNTALILFSCHSRLSQLCFREWQGNSGKTGVCLEIWCHKIQYNPMIHHIFPFEIAILWTSWYPPFSDPGTNNPSFTATPGITTLLTGELLQLRSSSSHQSTFAACPCRSTRALLGQDTWQQKIHAVAKVEVLSKGAV